MTSAPELTAGEGVVLLALARAAIRDELHGPGSLAGVRAGLALTSSLTALRACFVTLEKRGARGALELRGCVGSFEPRLPLHEAVVASARESAFADPRFPRLTSAEMDALVISVSALAPMTPLPDPGAIVPGRDGVAIESAGRRALFLPEVAEKHGWTVEELLAQLARKAGLPDAGWRGATLFRFGSIRFTEERARDC